MESLLTLYFPAITSFTVLFMDPNFDIPSSVKILSVKCFSPQWALRFADKVETLNLADSTKSRSQLEWVDELFLPNSKQDHDGDKNQMMPTSDPAFAFSSWKAYDSNNEYWNPPDYPDGPFGNSD